METNRFAPPRAEVADVVQGVAAPALWNPSAAARWSILLTPAFGALLQMKNWQALGEPERAASSKVWAIVNLLALGAIVVASAFLPDTKTLDALSRAAAVGLLLAWYFSSGRKQSPFVRARFADSYPRRGWTQPLLLALAAFVGFMVAAACLILAASMLGYET